MGLPRRCLVTLFTRLWVEDGLVLKSSGVLQPVCTQMSCDPARDGRECPRGLIWWRPLTHPGHLCMSLGDVSLPGPTKTTRGGHSPKQSVPAHHWPVLYSLFCHPHHLSAKNFNFNWTKRIYFFFPLRILVSQKLPGFISHEVKLSSGWLKSSKNRTIIPATWQHHVQGRTNQRFLEVLHLGFTFP